MKNPLWKCTLQRGFYKFNLFYFYSVLQVNRSVALTELRVQVIALLPFSEEMYLPLFPCKLIWLFPVLRTVNLSHPAKAERLQLIGAFPFSLEIKRLFAAPKANPLRAILPEPASTTLNFSQVPTLLRLHLMGALPFSLET